MSTLWHEQDIIVQVHMLSLSCSNSKKKKKLKEILCDNLKIYLIHLRWYFFQKNVWKCEINKNETYCQLKQSKTPYFSNLTFQTLHFSYSTIIFSISLKFLNLQPLIPKFETQIQWNSSPKITNRVVSNYMSLLYSKPLHCCFQTNLKKVFGKKKIISRIMF